VKYSCFYITTDTLEVFLLFATMNIIVAKTIVTFRFNFIDN